MPSSVEDLCAYLDENISFAHVILTASLLRGFFVTYLLHNYAKNSLLVMIFRAKYYYCHIKIDKVVVKK